MEGNKSWFKVVTLGKNRNSRPEVFLRKGF